MVGTAVVGMVVKRVGRYYCRDVGVPVVLGMKVVGGLHGVDGCRYFRLNVEGEVRRRWA